MKLNVLLAGVVLALPLAIARPLPVLPVVVPMTLSQSEWREFSSEPGQFVVSMPGVPTEETDADQQDMSNRLFTLQLQDESYMVGYLEMPQALNPSELQQLLEKGVVAFVEGAGAKLVSSRDIAFQEFAGKEFEFQTSVDNMPNGKGRIYVVQKRVYFVSVITPQPQNAQKFFDSFRLLTQ